MAFAPPKNLDGPKMQTKMSTWTPLNHQLLNEKVFEERRILLGKWFDKWTDAQRRRILTGLFEQCSLSQQKFCSRQLQERIPAEAVDFTTKLPRVLSLYIFSFLDPRSLCRCAQTPPKNDFIVPDIRTTSGDPSEVKQSPSSALHSSCSFRKKTNRGERDLPPWRSSDKHPTDIIRFNYLDNCDPIEQAWQVKKKGNELASDFSRQSHSKKNKFQDRAKLRKAQSLVSLGADFSCPLKGPTHLNWASHESLRCTKGKTQMVTHDFQEQRRILPSPI
ncbi:F-box only protein 16 isoform X3 [Monodelphis domestica]|uniref:F-box only protein 16 isoform X3 n=1 Tax=Monodelphis domestica TaxID=13616 RepID=UPI0024E1D50E|nr:F-box only protein 16 isoform X3 [Monodelphis domestica]